MTVEALEEITAGAAKLLRRDVAVFRLLAGGQHATTVMVTDGTTQYVVRAFPVSDDAVDHEVAILDRLGPLGSLAPRLIAHGRDSDRSIIITTAITGGTPETKLHLSAIASQMAAALARIHRLDGSGLRQEPLVPPSGDFPIAALARREWRKLDTSERVLTHYDFWCGNAIWNRGTLTGVVDWSGARDAPRGVDVAWCRLDFILLGSTKAADDFLTEYERQAGRVLPDIHTWDVQAAARAAPIVESWEPNYHGIGRTDLTASILRERMNTWTAKL